VSILSTSFAYVKKEEFYFKNSFSGRVISVNYNWIIICPTNDPDRLQLFQESFF